MTEPTIAVPAPRPSDPPTRADYEAYRARWKAVADKEAELLQATPPAVRTRQLQALWSAVRSADLVIATPEDVAQVRARWNLLRQRFHEQSQSNSR